MNIATGKTQHYIQKEYNVVLTDYNIHVDLLVLISISGTWYGKI
jgi:hypothetical protein